MTGRGELKIGNDWMTLLLLFGTQDLYEVYASSFDIAEYMMHSLRYSPTIMEFWTRTA